MQEYARVCQSMPEYARVCQIMPEYNRVCQSMPEYARVCQSMQEYARVCQSMPDRPQRWSIFQGDGMVNVFLLGHHCRQWFFNGFDKVGPSPLNVFLGVQPLKPMVFRWFSKF